MDLETSNRKCGYCYALFHSNGKLKLGRTASPRRRMKTHFRKAKQDGLEVEIIAISNIVDDFLISEKEMLLKASNSLPAIGSEEFLCESRGQAAKLINEMPVKLNPYRSLSETSRLEDVIKSGNLQYEESESVKKYLRFGSSEKMLNLTHLDLAMTALGISRRDQLAKTIGIGITTLNAIYGVVDRKVTIDKRQEAREKLDAALRAEGWEFGCGGIVKIPDAKEGQSEK